MAVTCGRLWQLLQSADGVATGAVAGPVDHTGTSASIHCSLVTQPPIGPIGPETS